MPVTPDFGNERWKIVRNLSEYFLVTNPIGETWKFGNGGVEKGPATRPRDTFLFKLANVRLRQGSRQVFWKSWGTLPKETYISFQSKDLQ